MVRKRKVGVRRPLGDEATASAGTEWTSEWELLPKDMLAQVIAQRSSLCCKVRSVCKAWRQQAIASPVDLDITLQSPEMLDSFAIWLQQQSWPAPPPQPQPQPAQKQAAPVQQQQASILEPISTAPWPSLTEASFLHVLDDLIKHHGVPADLAPYMASYALSQTEFLSHFCGLQSAGDSLQLTDSLIAWARKHIDSQEADEIGSHEAAAELAKLFLEKGQDAWKDHLPRWGPVMLPYLMLNQFDPQLAQVSSTSAVSDAPKLELPQSPDRAEDLQQPVQSLESTQHIAQQINSLRLFAWTNYQYRSNAQSWFMSTDMGISNSLWQGLQTAQILNLTLGEFLTHSFFQHLPSLQHTPGAANLQSLNSLTLHINMFDNTLFQPGSDVNASGNGLQALSQMTSLTLICNEVHPSGSRVRHGIRPVALLRSLPDSIQSLALHNFRQRWCAFKQLSHKPRLVNLDLTGSAAFFPEDPQHWTQLQQLKLCSSLIWFSEPPTAYFSTLTRLTELNLHRCLFAAHAPGRFINTHHLVSDQLTVPASLVTLNLSTRSVKGLKLTEPLTALTSLTLHEDCNVRDIKPPLSSKSDLRISYDSLNKAYHGEWWDQLKQLRAKCPSHVALGVEGLYPTGLEVLQLHSENPEPMFVTTGKMVHLPKPYPHQAVPRPAAAAAAAAAAEQSHSRTNDTRTNGKVTKGTGSKGAQPKSGPHQPVKCSPLPHLRVLELTFSGCLHSLILTGLPSLQHLTVSLKKPRTPPEVTKRCRAVKLPESLLTLDWTTSCDYNDMEQHLKHLHHLPRLAAVGFHGLVPSVPELPPSVTRLDLSSTLAPFWLSYRRMKRLTHLDELVLPWPLDSDNSQAMQVQRHLKRHHVQIQIKDKDPFTQGSVGTCLHPSTPDSDEEEDPYEALLARQDAAVFDDVDNAMQFALLADAAVNA